MSLFVHEFPGPSFRFRRNEDVSDPVRVVARVGATFAVLAPVMAPLVVEVDLGRFESALGMRCCDEVVQEHRRALAVAGRPDGVVVAIRADRVEVHDTVTPALIEEWLARQLGIVGGERCLGVVELAVTVIHHEFNQLDATVAAEWSWWSVGPGREDLDRALGLLAADGWLRL